MNLSFTVPGHPVPTARPRVFTPKGAKFQVATTPPKTREYQKAVRLHAQTAVARNAAWRLFIAAHPTGRLYRVQMHFVLNADRGDWDNYAKVIDAMNGVVFADDRQIAQGMVSLHVDKKAAPRLEVFVDLATLLDKPAWMAVALEQGWRPPCVG